MAVSKIRVWGCFAMNLIETLFLAYPADVHEFDLLPVLVFGYWLVRRCDD